MITTSLDDLEGMTLVEMRRHAHRRGISIVGTGNALAVREAIADVILARERCAEPWVPAWETKPSDCETVLCCGSKGGLFIARWCPNRNLRGGGTWMSCNGGRTVAAWMPLPDPWPCRAEVA